MTDETPVLSPVAIEAIIEPVPADQQVHDPNWEKMVSDLYVQMVVRAQDYPDPFGSAVLSADAFVLKLKSAVEGGKK